MGVNRLALLQERLKTLLTTQGVTLNTNTQISVGDLKFILQENAEMHKLSLKLLKKQGINLKDYNKSVLMDYLKNHPEKKEFVDFFSGLTETTEEAKHTV